MLGGVYVIFMFAQITLTGLILLSEWLCFVIHFNLTRPTLNSICISNVDVAVNNILNSEIVVTNANHVFLVLSFVKNKSL